MKTIKQIEAILKSNHFEVEKSISGYYRLLKNNKVVHDEPACDDVYEYDVAIEHFYFELTDNTFYEVYLAHDWNDDMKNRHYLTDHISHCIYPEFFSYNETEAVIFANKQEAQAIADEINNDLLEEGMDAKAIVYEFELFEDIDDEE